MTRKFIPKITLYAKKLRTENKDEVILVDKKQSKREIDKNFFNEMNYELAGDIGAIDNEDMKNNKKLITGKNNNDKNSKGLK